MTAQSSSKPTGAALPLIVRRVIEDVLQDVEWASRISEHDRALSSELVRAAEALRSARARLLP